MTEQQRTFSRKFIQLDAWTAANRICWNTHHEKSFPAAYSYCISESKAAFDFSIDAFLSVCFGDDEAPEPQVILSDQAEGLMVSFPTQIPGAVSQLCEWHAVQNIRAYCLKAKYSKSGTLFTTWLGNTFRLKRAPRQSRRRALSCTKSSQQHRSSIWVPKGNRLARYYTKGLANLGCYTTQLKACIQ